ncbi:nucleoside/nucleotide kinase family protein [Parasporobacterium paucivorans]|uniref:Guanylate kinase n=1 Tax=Parasporobacterium paucivorans DSM 15970 TaxID=1122934 RepID=A0A1M6L5M4_9FIRM|nr:hypothetical protein [Parasporobacterium paucivorans]SHJ66497.1 guanylate kinase [Parasporobacterium paucivorans DSM 15970]
MSVIYYLLGKSSTGKDTIFSRLMADKKLNLKTLTGYTTRPIRKNEVDGREYHFVDEKTMRELESAGKIIEIRSYPTIHGIWYYFTADDGHIGEEEGEYLMIGTLESYMKLREFFGEVRVRPIYIEVDDALRLERAIQREKIQKKPALAEVCRRFLADEEDFSEEKIRQADIVKRYENKDIDACAEEIARDILLYKR